MRRILIVTLPLLFGFLSPQRLDARGDEALESQPHKVVSRPAVEAGRSSGESDAYGFAARRASAAGAASEDEDWRLLGGWDTVANGDDVRALLRDEESLWAATKGGGVVRWQLDGEDWAQYVAPQHGLSSNDVRDLVKWRGTIWFATGDGLAAFDEAEDRVVVVDALLPSPSVTALAVDASDRLWIGTEQYWDPHLTLPGQERIGGWSGGGIALTADGLDYEVLGTTGGLPSTNVRDLVLWRGAIWAATEPYRTWQPPKTGDDPKPGGWVYAGGGVARFAAGEWQTFDSKTTDAMSDSARALAGGPDALWVATAGRGLVAFDGATWQAHMDCGDASQCIQDNYATTVHADAYGAVWVGTSRFNGYGTGVDVLDPRGTPTDGSDDVWHVISAADGLPGERVHAILADTDGTVWIGTANLDADAASYGTGLARLLADRATLEVRLTSMTQHGAPADNDITVTQRNPATGELWVGTLHSGLSVLDESGVWRQYTRASTSGGLGSDHIADIAIESGGTVWVATRQTIYDPDSGDWVDGGLSRFSGGTWTKFSGPDSGLPSDHLSALAIDRSNRLWVGTGGTDRGTKEHAFRGWGLAVLDAASGAWQRTYAFPTITSNNVTDLYATDRELWVVTSYFYYVDTRPGGAQLSTGGGVSVLDLDSGRWRKLAEAEGMTVAARTSTGASVLDFRSIHVDEDGTAWVGGLTYSDGAVQPEAAPDGIVDVIRGDSVEHHSFPATGPVVGLARDPQGNLWAATAQGGARLLLNGEWLTVATAPGGLPTDRLTAMMLHEEGIWLGTAGSGLARFVPSATAGALPADPPSIVRRLPHHVFVPSLRRSVTPRVVRWPGL